MIYLLGAITFLDAFLVIVRARQFHRQRLKEKGRQENDATEQKEDSNTPFAIVSERSDGKSFCLGKWSTIRGIIIPTTISQS